MGGMLHQQRIIPGLPNLTKSRNKTWRLWNGFPSFKTQISCRLQF